MAPALLHALSTCKFLCIGSLSLQGEKEASRAQAQGEAELSQNLQSCSLPFQGLELNIHKPPVGPLRSEWGRPTCDAGQENGIEDNQKPAGAD